VNKVVAVNKPAMGLGNRMRFTLSCLLLSKEVERQFEYIWPISPTFKPKFTDLWYFKELDVTDTYTPQEKYFFTHTKGITQYSDMSDWLIQSEEQIADPAGNQYDWVGLLQKLKPVPAIRSRVTRMAKKLPSDYVAVNVRTQVAPPASTEESPLDWYLRRMHELVDNNTNTTFFLSCDSDEVQERLMREFPGRTEAQAIPSSFGSVESVQKAVADLYLLGRSSLILAPFGSSFARLGWFLGGSKQPYEVSKFTVAPGTPAIPPGLVQEAELIPISKLNWVASSNTGGTKVNGSRVIAALRKRLQSVGHRA